MNRQTFFKTAAILAATLLQGSIAAPNLPASKTVEANDAIPSPTDKRALSFKNLRTRKEEILWEQVGGDLLGENGDDKSGYSVDMSANGKRIVVGAIDNSGTVGNDSGHVRVYQEVNGAWVQVGQDIDGEGIRDWSGYSVGMSSSGKRVIIGAYANNGNGCNSGHARIYEEVEGVWVQVGDDIDGEEESDWYGSSVDINSDGTMVIIGAPRNDKRGNMAGHARVHKEVDGAWVQVGNAIDGEDSWNYAGHAVAMNGDGKRVIIGAYSNSGYGGEFKNIGHARVFFLAGGSSWIQYGPDIDGEAVNDESGVSVDISDDGTRVIIGASLNDGNGVSSGHARVYKEQGAGSSTPWLQIGEDIDGAAAGDEAGNSVKISSDGKSVIVGSKLNGGAAGHARVYEEVEGAWVQVGDSINGDAADDQAGFSVGMDADGSRVIVGSPYHDGNGVGEKSGLVRVFFRSDMEEPYIPPPTPSPTPNNPNNPSPTNPINDSPTPESSSFIVSRPSYSISVLLGLAVAVLLH